MLDEYRLKGPTKKIELEVEAEVADKLHRMQSHTKISLSEMANVALKRFISAHKDFLPTTNSVPQQKAGD